MVFVSSRQGLALRLVLCLIVGAAIIRVAVAQTAPDQATRSFERGMTIWTGADEILNNYKGIPWTTLSTFCRELRGAQDPGMEGLLRNPVTHLYVAANAFVSGGDNDQFLLHKFIREAHSRGLTVDCIAGEGGWINRDAGECSRLMNNLLAFNKGGDPDQRLDGMLFDVRPEGWSRWFTADKRGQVAAMLKSSQAKANAAGDRLRIGLAVPRWYYSRIGRDAMVELMGLVKFIVVDDYVDQVSPLVSGFANESSIADSLGVDIYAGINAEANMNPSLTFYEEGWLTMERAVTDLCTTYGNRKSFRGVIINDYQSYADLRRSRHSLEAARSWSVQEGRVLAALNRDSADLLVIDAVTDTSKFPKRFAIERLQHLGTASRAVLYPIALTSMLSITNPVSDLKRATRADVLKLLSRALDIGCDGILVDVRSADSLMTRAGAGDISADIAATLDTLAYAVRDMYSHPTATIVMRGGEALLANASPPLFAKIIAVIDGEVCEVPGPMFFRQRDAYVIKLWRRTSMPESADLGN